MSAKPTAILIEALASSGDIGRAAVRCIAELERSKHELAANLDKTITLAVDALKRAAELEAENRALSDALTMITEMDGDQPARSDWDMLRIARAALKAAP